MFRTLTLIFMLVLPFSAASSGRQLDVGVSYYFDSFDPDQRPWAPGRPLNIEEVFKNYQYYEIILGGDGRDVTVNHFVRGSRTGSENYTLMPDGSLRRNSPSSHK
jgi:hypothetical protein